MQADKAIKLLDGLVDQLYYFYNGDEESFKKHVLKDATEIENILKNLAVNKKETFRRISNKYEEYYKRKSEALENAVIGVTDADLNDSIRERYRQNIEKD